MEVELDTIWSNITPEDEDQNPHVIIELPIRTTVDEQTFVIKLSFKRRLNEKEWKFISAEETSV